MDSKLIFPVDNKIDQTNYFIYSNAINEEQLIWIDNLQKMHSFEEAKIVGNIINDSNIRKSSIKWMHPNDKNNWLYEHLGILAMGANDVVWKFSLHSIIDAIQYTEYYEGGGHYDWHMDIGPNLINHRKISITVQLSNPDDYEGGDLEIWSGGDFKTLPRKKGCSILFPSFLLHRITPITKGIRKSLVLWVGGDTFR